MNSPTQPTTVRLNGSSGSTGEPFDIPGGSEPVSVIRLGFDRETRAFSLQVTFPAGWERPVTGHYVCAEDVVFLSGRLRIGDEIFTGGDWAHMPAGFLRSGMRAEAETLAVARFGGPARWVEGPATSSPPLTRRALRDGGELAPAPIGGAGVLLRSGAPASSWFLPDPPVDAAIASCDAEIVDLTSRVWHRVGIGAQLPRIIGDAFAWTFEP